MPALAAIEPPNIHPPLQEPRQDEQPQKKKTKPSSLCYTPPAMINDKKRDRSYFRRGLLGEGGFARCFEVTDFQGTRLAAKCIAKASIVSEKVKMKLLGEIKVHKSMDHPNIVRQRDCFEDDVNVYMILDICTNGTLMEMLRNRKRFTEPETRYFGIQILGAAKYMHSRRVIHRDLKLGNLFLDEDMCIKVGDFGLAALLVDDADRKKTICGTPNYIAPEVLFGSAEGHSYEVDLWSIGVIFYVMLVGKPPFQSKEIKTIYAKIKTNEYEFPAGCNISENAKELITSLLSTDPEHRPSIDDIARHSFFNTGVMPRSIPPSAVRHLPDFPAGQSSSVFKRNLAFVTSNAGIGTGHIVGKEQGKSVDVIVEKPETGRYLPVSLSPRTGPTAKMVNLQTERTGGRTSSLSDRLHSVKLEDDQAQSLAARRREEAKGRDLRRTTLGAGALRLSNALAQKENVNPADHPVNVDKALPKLRGATRMVHATAETDIESSSRPRSKRVISEPTRPITRSARFTQAQSLAQLDVIQSDSQAASIGPARRAASANVLATTGRGVTLSKARLPVADADGQSIRGISPDTIGSSSRTSSTQGRTSGRPISRTATHEVKTNAPNLELRTRTTVNLAMRTGRSSPVSTIWTETRALCDHLQEALKKRTSRQSYTQNNDFTMTYISKWVDYSHRYGLGYELSNGSTGVYFNDLSSIILPPLSSDFTFISSDKQGQYKVDSPPRDLEKKVYLLKHFKGYMNQHLNCSGQVQDSKAVGHETYMTHYHRSKEGILFRLSDGTIQVNFTDHSKVMIPACAASYETSAVKIRYVDIAKEVTCGPLDQVMVHEPGRRQKVEIVITLLNQFIDEGEAEASAIH